MKALSFLNFNFELMRPECAGDFGALKKVQVAVYMPLFAAAIIVVYAVVKLATLSGGTAAHRHAARHYLWRKIVTIVTTLYTVGAIFFVRTFLRAFHCVGNADGADGLYMASSPDIECTMDDPSSDYPAIRSLSVNGLAVFGGLFVLMCASLVRAHHSDNPGMGSLSFLGDKYEDDWYTPPTFILILVTFPIKRHISGRRYYWEMVSAQPPPAQPADVTVIVRACVGDRGAQGAADVHLPAV